MSTATSGPFRSQTNKQITNKHQIQQKTHFPRFTLRRKILDIFSIVRGWKAKNEKWTKVKRHAESQFLGVFLAEK